MPDKFLLSLLAYRKYTEGIQSIQDLAKEHYNTLLDSCRGNVAEAENRLFHVFGSSSLTNDYFDAVNNGCMFRLRVCIASKMPTFIGSSMSLYRLFYFALLLFRVTLYYGDMAKDILIAAHFKYKILGRVDLANLAVTLYPLSVFGSIILSVFLTELLNGAVVFRNAHHLLGTGLFKRTVAIMVTPLMPAFALFLEARQHLKLVETCLNNVQMVRTTFSCIILQLVFESIFLFSRKQNS